MTERKPPSHTADQFLVRLPPGMRDTIAEAARKSGRSMNSEIVSRLAESLARIPVETLLQMDVKDMAKHGHIRRMHGDEAADREFFPEAISPQKFAEWLSDATKLREEVAELRERLSAVEKKV